MQGAQSQGDGDPDSLVVKPQAQDAIGKAKSQSPMCGEDAARKEAD